MSAALVEQFRGDFHPNDFKDEYPMELQALIEEELNEGDSLDTAATFGGKESAAGNIENDGDNVINLMDALQRSIEQKSARSAGDSATKASGKSKIGGGKKVTTAAPKARSKKTSSKTAGNTVRATKKGA